ncbi:hypothetical protein EON65_36995 [archaeon]|nr:MAG: hypothetical protein EON65_36995 [archaeon]
MPSHAHYLIPHPQTAADLVIIMGTSLKVYPFAFLLQAIDDSVPVVLVNRENPGISRDKLLFLPGEIEETIDGLVKELGWEL